MKQLTQEKRENAIALINQGKSIRYISQHLHLGYGTVQRLLQMSGVQKNSKTGRPRKLSERQKLYCVRKITSGGIQTASNVAKELENEQGLKVHRTTISRALNESGLRSGEKKKKPALSKKNMKERLTFAKKYSNWTTSDWKRVIFSDETKINRFNSDGRSWSWFREGETLQPRNVAQNVKHGGGSIMIWGCICADGVGYMCKIDGRMDKDLYLSILKQDLQKTIEYYNIDESEMIFQHDNDPKHKARMVQKWLSERDFTVLDWPAQSPDLNPIENLWAHLKRKLNSYETPPNGIFELWERVQDEWNRIESETCLKLIESMPHRLSEVIKAKGRWTRY